MTYLAEFLLGIGFFAVIGIAAWASLWPHADDPAPDAQPDMRLANFHLFENIQRSTGKGRK